MATKKRTRKNPMRGRIMVAALSLCLLAAAGMIGMYTVGRSENEQREEELARKAAEAEKAFEEARKLEEELEEQKQQVASSTAKAEFKEEEKEKEPAVELESNYAGLEPTREYFLTEEEQAALDEEAEEAELLDAASLEAEALTYSFSPETDKLIWPLAGNIIMDYSMDKTVFYETLQQYKYNPAIVIQAEVDHEVLCGADGQVTKIEETDELGTTVTVDFGNGYEGVYGQLKDVAVEEGSPIQAGVKLGLVNEPTRFYVKEGANVYFKVLQNGKPVDPLDLLQ